MKSPFLLQKRGQMWYVRFAGEMSFHSTGLTNRRDATAFAQREAGKLVSSATDDQVGLPVSPHPTEPARQPYRLKKRGSYWYVRFADERTFHTTHCKRRFDAERAANGEYLRRSQSKEPDAKLKDFACDFFIWDTCAWVARQRAKSRPCTKPTQDNRRGYLKNHILPQFGRWRMSKITAVEVEDWMVSLPLASQTINHILYAFRIVMREAKRQGIIEKNPIDEVEPMGKNFQPTSALTDEELKSLFPDDPVRFAEIWPEFRWGVMFALMVSSGMRPGEARALEWQSVLLDVPGVMISHAVTASDEIGPTKGKLKRAAIIPKRTAELIRRWREICGFDAGFVFFGEDGGHLSRYVAYNNYKAGLKRANILRDHIDLRSMRTTYNTRMRQMLLANSMPEDLLRFFIGHRSVQMTDRYDDPVLEARLRALRQVGDKVNEFWD